MSRLSIEDRECQSYQTDLPKIKLSRPPSVPLNKVKTAISSRTFRTFSFISEKIISF